MLIKCAVLLLRQLLAKETETLLLLLLRSKLFTLLGFKRKPRSQSDNRPLGPINSCPHDKIPEHKNKGWIEPKSYIKRST